jgi:hypothetical protein
LALAKQIKKKKPAVRKEPASLGKPLKKPTRPKTRPQLGSTGASAATASAKRRPDSKLRPLTSRLKGKAVKERILAVEIQAKNIAGREPKTWREDDISMLSDLIHEVTGYRKGWNYDRAELAIGVMRKSLSKITRTLHPPPPRPKSINPDRTRINEYGAASGRITYATRKRRG